MASQQPVGKLVSVSLLSTTTTFCSLRLATSARSSSSFFLSISVAYTFPVIPTVSAAANEYFPSPAPISATVAPGFQPISNASRLISPAAFPRASTAKMAAARQVQSSNNSRFLFIFLSITPAPFRRLTFADSRPSIFLLAPFGGSANPTMGTEFCLEFGRQRTLVACGQVGFDMFALAHTGDGRVDVGIVQDEAQGHFGQGHAVRQKRLEGIGALDTGFEIFRDVVGTAPVVLRPAAVERERAGERAFVEGHASDDGNVFLAARGKKLVLGILVKDIVDHLDGVDKAGAHGADSVRGFPTVEAETDGAGLSAVAQFVNGRQNPRICEPGVFPGVQLNEVECVHPDIF